MMSYIQGPQMKVQHHSNLRRTQTLCWHGDKKQMCVGSADL